MAILDGCGRLLLNRGTSGLPRELEIGLSRCVFLPFLLPPSSSCSVLLGAVEGKGGRATGSEDAR